MHLTKTKIKKLEFIALKFRVDPDVLVDALLYIGVKRSKRKNIENPRKFTPEEKVKAIEEEALNKGWTYEQLWCIPPHKRYDVMGLICFVDKNTTIGEVTEKHISLIHEKPVGEPVIRNFYNNKAEQPWIKKSIHP